MSEFRGNQFYKAGQDRTFDRLEVIRRRWFCRPEFQIRDAWIGAYWKRQPFWSLDVWVCLIPFLPIHFGWKLEE